jgi:protein gp37
VSNTNTKIAWTDATWSPVTGCSKVSPGCAHCYAETLSHRFGTTTKPWTPEHAAENVVLHPERLDAPLRWKKPRRVFVNSMSDLFHELVPVDFIAGVFMVMAACAPSSLRPHGGDHTFQVLTKRPERMHAFIANYTFPSGRTLAEQPLPNVWLGVSVENQHFADERIPLLLQTPAQVHFLSCEPLLAPVDLREWVTVNGGGRYGRLYAKDAVNWVIVGGESGPKHRPMDLAWARQIRDLCAETGTPLFVKQLGGTRPGTALPALPEDLRVREYPKP